MSDGAPRVRRRRRWIVALGLAVVAAVAVVALYVALRPAPLIEPSLVAEVAPSGEAHLGRAGSGVAYRHDKLLLRATSPQPAEIRVYDERGLLIGRCGDGAAPGCGHSGARDDRTYRLEVALQRLGVTRALLIIGDPVPPSAGNLGDDLEAARHLRVVLLAPLKVL